MKTDTFAFFIAGRLKVKGQGAKNLSVTDVVTADFNETEIALVLPAARFRSDSSSHTRNA